MEIQEQNQGTVQGQNQEPVQVHYQEQNYGSSNFLAQQPLPNATAALVLGIVSIVTSCCCLGVPGLITGVIGLVLGINATKLYVSNRDTYSEASYKNANAGKICSIIGLAFGLIFVVRFIMQWALITELVQAYLDGTLDPSDYSNWF